MNSLLNPIGKIYGWVMDARNALYDRSFFRVYDLGAKTISVGNLTTGGTGKTPLVALIAEILAEQGETVCILTRGYGRKNANRRVLVSDGKAVFADAETGGDEPVELARKLIGKAIVIADADRVAAGTWAKKQFGVTVFILDDGFQHRRVKRDLDLVCIDATNPFGGGEVLPAGRLCEPLENLKRTDVVVVTRSNLVNETENLRSQISNLNPEAEVFISRNSVKQVLPLKEFHAATLGSEDDAANPKSSIGWEKLRSVGDPTNTYKEVRILAFCSLGNPDNFSHQLEQEFDDHSMSGFALSILKKFPDHHIYSQQDVGRLEKEAAECKVDVLVTTAKDAVKLTALKFKLPVFVVEIDLQVDDIEGLKASL